MAYRYSWKRAVALALRRPLSIRPRQLDFDETTVFPELMHCLDCGACCRAREGTILIVDEDIERWRRLGERDIIDGLVPGHFGQLAFAMTKESRCRYQGTAESPYACAIYGRRATVCRAFEMSCPQCFDIRRNRHRPL